MITTILFPWLLREWKYFAIIGLLLWAIYAVYTRGYHSCEEDVAFAKQKATEAAQMLAGQEKQKIQEDNKKEIQKHLTLEKELTDELNKKIYTDCVLPSNGVRALNRFGQ